MDITRLRKLSDRIKGQRGINLQDLLEVHEIIHELLDWLRKILPLGPDVVDIMTYKEVMSYFVDNRPADPRVAKGALLLLPHREGKILFQAFLDQSNEFICTQDGKPHGRQLIVRRFDRELMDIFGDKDLVIVE